MPKTDSETPVGRRHAGFLAGRLRGLGIDVRLPENAAAAVGALPLSPSPFPSLKGSFVVERARFYTLGHKKLKLYEPAAFFLLPPIDVGRCESVAAIEAALRRAWSEYIGELLEAHRWLTGIGVTVHTDGAGAQLLFELSDTRGPPARIRSRREVLVPSAGPLREKSAHEPADRSYRPVPGTDHVAEFETGIVETLDQIARRARPLAGSRAAPIEPDQTEKERPRILLVDDDRSVRAAAETALALRDFRVDAYPDPLSALEALRTQSYEVVLVDARMPRMDGLELVIQIRNMPGLARLPVLLFDERPSPASRHAAESLGAVGYLAKPSRWTDLAEGLLDLIEGWSQRRFERYPVRLRVESNDGAGAPPDLTFQVGRRGMGVQTRRDVLPGLTERYRITLPGSLGTVNIDGEVVHRTAEQGHVSLRLGIRFLGFPDGDEERWIRFVDSLAKRARPDG